MRTTFLVQHKALVVAAAVLVLGAGVCGVVAWSGREKSTLPKELSADALKAESDDPGKVMERIRQAMESGNLSEAQRHELRQNVHTVMEAHMNQRLDEFFAAGETQRRAVLDRHLDEMQVRFREWEQRRAQREREGAGANTGDRRRDGNRAAGAPGGGAGPGPVAGGGPGAGPGSGPPRAGPGDGRFREPTREQRKMRSESRDPDQMARRMAYFTALRQRAEERGIQMPGRMGMGRP